MSSPDGECRSVSNGVMNIRKSVVIMRKCKMGGCENHYLSMTWAAPIHSRICSNKAPQKGKWMVCLSRFACDPARKEHLFLKRWIGRTWIYKLRLKTASHRWLKNARLACPRQFFSSKKTIVLPVRSGVPSIFPILMPFQRLNTMLVLLFNRFMRPLLPKLL